MSDRKSDISAPQRRKAPFQVIPGPTCNICGKPCGKVAALKKHVETSHGVPLAHYLICFYGSAKTLIADWWEDSPRAPTDKDRLVTHVFVRRFSSSGGNNPNRA